MRPLDCPFRSAEKEIEKLKKKTGIIIVDMHAEATSEKQALGWFLDGRVSAVLGTHTHVQTADEKILPNGTAYITDLGMTGMGGASGVGATSGAYQAKNISAPTTELPNFTDSVRNLLNKVNDVNVNSEKMADAYQRGEDIPLTDVVLGMQKASLSFEATLQVRNKVLKAYEDIMNMPV